MFNFKEVDKLNYRSEFANAVFKLIYEKHNGDLDKCLIDAKLLADYFREQVRNIYELVYSEIPMWSLLDLRQYGKDNYDLSENEYLDAIERTKEACKRYYS